MRQQIAVGELLPGADVEEVGERRRAPACRSSGVRRQSAHASPASASTTSTTPNVPSRFVVRLYQKPLPTFSKPSQPRSMMRLCRQEVAEEVARVEHDERRADDEGQRASGAYTPRDEQPQPDERRAAAGGDAARRLAAAGVDGGHGRRQHEHAEVVLGGRREAGGGTAPAISQRRAARPASPPGAAAGAGQQREGRRRDVGDGHVRVGHVQRRDGEEERREQAGRAAEGVPAEPVHEVHRGRADGHREQPAEQEVRPRVDDEGRHARAGSRCASSHSTGAASRYERADQVEEERRIEEELRVQVRRGRPRRPWAPPCSRRR